jgi:hypothetical protein
MRTSGQTLAPLMLSENKRFGFMGLAGAFRCKNAIKNDLFAEM